MVRSNNGAPGVDRTTLAEVEEYGVARLLDEVAAELREDRYRPLPARRVMIPKPGVKGEYRPLSIPAVRDRIVQAAVKIVFEPVFEADMLGCSFGFVQGGRRTMPWARSPVGGRDGYRQLLFGDSARQVDASGRGTCL
jgi:retron-type reverse transcriptase